MIMCEISMNMSNIDVWMEKVPGNCSQYVQQQMKKIPFDEMI